VPELAVTATNHLALESNCGGRRLVTGHVSHGLAVALRVSPNTNDFLAGRQCSGDRRERQRGTSGPWVVVRREAD
jgi:hypothetical protein